MTSSTDPRAYREAVFAWAKSAGLTSVKLGIYQPKVNGATEWTCSMAELEEFAAELETRAAAVQAADAAHKTQAPDVWWRLHLNPEPDDQACAWCRAMPICPSVQAKLQRDTGLDFTAMPDEATLMARITAYEPVELSDFLKAVPLLEMASKAARAETERRLMAGVPVKDFGLELGRQGNREVSDPEEAERMVRKQFRVPIEQAYSMKLKSVTQLEKLTKPGKAEDGSTVPPAIGPRQWKQFEALIVRADAKPSVKPLSTIKNPWTPPQITADEFKSVDEGCDLS